MKMKMKKKKKRTHFQYQYLHIKITITIKMKVKNYQKKYIIMEQRITLKNIQKQHQTIIKQEEVSDMVHLEK